jgi:hypothetical protein
LILNSIGWRKKIDCCKVKSLPPPKVEGGCGGNYCDFFPDDCNADADDYATGPPLRKRDIVEKGNETWHILEKRAPTRSITIEWPSGDSPTYFVEGQPSRSALFRGRRVTQVLNSFAHRANPGDCTDTRVTFQHIPDVRNLPDWTADGETEHVIDVG